MVVVVFAGAVATTGDTERFSVAALAAGFGWAVLCAVARWLQGRRLREVARVAGSWMIFSAVIDAFHRPPGRR